MKNKKLNRTLKRIMRRIDKKNLNFNLLSFKTKIIDVIDTQYYVDSDIQRNRYFKTKHQIEYLDSFFEGSAIMSIIMANITECHSYLTETLQMNKHERTYKYYQKLWEAGYEWLSIDGNNRIGAWIDFFSDKLFLPKGFILPLFDCTTGEMFDIELEKKMTYSMIMEEFGDEFTEYMRKQTIPITQINYANKSMLHVIFRNVNKGASLNAQEDRNCIDVTIAETVRQFSNTNSKWFDKQYKEDGISKRNHESFVAWSYGCVQDYGQVFNSKFGDKANIQMKETNITKHYENNTISDETITITDNCLNKLKTFINQTNAGENFLSNNTQFSRALLGFIYRLKKFYVSHDWPSIYSFIWKNHQEWLDSEVTYKFDHIAKKRTYGDMTSSGTLYLSTIFQFLVRLETLMLENGLMKKKLARGSVSSHDTRMKLNTSQNSICPLTGNEIDGYNDTDKYHVDHIVPISKWDVKDEEWVQTIVESNPELDPNHISNLQLVEKGANLMKSDKIMTQTSIDKFTEVEEKLEVA